MQRDFASVRRTSMFEQINPLPSPQGEPAGDDRNGELYASQRRPDVGRHVVGAFVCVPISPRLLRRDAFKECLQHGDLLDVIRESCGLIDFKDVADEARSFLSLPHPEPEPDRRRSRTPSAPTGSPEAARRLFAMSQPIESTLVELQLHNRGITPLHGTGSLRFHPRCYTPLTPKYENWQGGLCGSCL